MDSIVSSIEKIVPLITSILAGGAVFYIFYIFMSEASVAAATFRSEQLKKGEEKLLDAAIFISPSVFFFTRVTLSLLLFSFFSFAIHILFGVILGLAGFFGPKIFLDNLKFKRVKKIEEQLVGGLELLGNCLKSGLNLQQAIELLVKEVPAPLSTEFTIVLAENRLGKDFNEALANMSVRLGSVVVDILATGVAITRKCGGDLTEVFSNIAQTIRDQATIEGKLDAVTAQGRFQGQILGAMPFLLILILYFANRPHVVTLFGTNLGLIAFCSVVVMVVLAQLWIRKLLDIDV